MAVYVDDVAHPYRRMKMCHLWADTHEELLAMVDRIGVGRHWLQKPPEASWVHFDICQTKKAKAIQFGAILMDRYAPVEHVARLKGNIRQIENVRHLREAKGMPLDGRVITCKASSTVKTAEQPSLL